MIGNSKVKMQKSKLQVKIQNWPSKKILECIQKLPKKSGVPLKNYQKTGKFPVIDQGQDFIGGYTDDESIVYSNVLPVVVFGDHTRAIKFIDFPFVVGADGTKVLKPKDFLDPKFFYFALMSLDVESRGYARHFRILKEKEIPLPPIAEQKKIVARLEGLLGKIREAKRLRAEAQEAAQNLLPAELHRIFSQPVRQAQGKQHTNKLEYVGMSGKSASVKNYGEAQWEEKNLEEICEKTTNIKWSDHKNNNFQYVDLTSVSRDDFSIAETKEVNSKNAPSRAKKVIKTNDVIFGTTRPTLMRVTRIPEEFNNHICSTGFTVLRAKKERVLPQFIYYFIRSERFMNRMESVQTGASYPAVSDAKVMETKIPLPPVAEQKKIVARLDSLSEKISSLRQAQAKTASDFISLEQSILSKSFQ